jgi:hypothetical protein
VHIATLSRHACLHAALRPAALLVEVRAPEVPVATACSGQAVAGIRVGDARLRDRPGPLPVPNAAHARGPRVSDVDGNEVEIHAIIDLEGGIDPVVPQRELSDVYIYWPILDGPLPNEDTVRGLARFISSLLDCGYKVLMHCRAGKNRASLVTGRVLIERGYEPEGAVRLLRDRRAEDILGNATFLDWLMQEDPPAETATPPS